MERTAVAVQVFPAFKGQVSPRWVRRVVRTVLATEPQPPGRVQVGVVVADDETVRALNRRYRGLDETTDVLAFSPDHAGPYEGEGPAPLQEEVPFPTPPGRPRPLGEVILSYPQAERQAQEAGRPVRREVAHLLVHGVLHLLGYDHAEEDEAKAMRTREEEVLQALFGEERG